MHKVITNAITFLILIPPVFYFAVFSSTADYILYMAEFQIYFLGLISPSVELLFWTSVVSHIIYVGIVYHVSCISYLYIMLVFMSILTHKVRYNNRFFCIVGIIFWTKHLTSHRIYIMLCTDWRTDAFAWSWRKYSSQISCFRCRRQQKARPLPPFQSKQRYMDTWWTRT